MLAARLRSGNPPTQNYDTIAEGTIFCSPKLYPEPSSDSLIPIAPRTLRTPNAPPPRIFCWIETTAERARAKETMVRALDSILQRKLQRITTVHKERERGRVNVDNEDSRSERQGLEEGRGKKKKNVLFSLIDKTNLFIKYNIYYE